MKRHGDILEEFSKLYTNYTEPETHTPKSLLFTCVLGLCIVTAMFVRHHKKTLHD